MLVCFSLSIRSTQSGHPSASDRFLLIVSVVCNTYTLVRELLQAASMIDDGLGYLTDIWNLSDVVSISLVYGIAITGLIAGESELKNPLFNV